MKNTGEPKFLRMRYIKTKNTGDRAISPDAEAMMSNRRLTALLICQSFNQVDDFPIGNVAPEAADDFVGLNGVGFARHLAIDDVVPVPPRTDIEVVRMIFIMGNLVFSNNETVCANFSGGAGCSLPDMPPIRRQTGGSLPACRSRCKPPRRPGRTMCAYKAAGV